MQHIVPTTCSLEQASMSKSWFKTFVRPTPEYIGGVLAGAGAGLMIGAWLSQPLFPIVFLIGSILVGTGSTIAFIAQQKSRKQDAATNSN